MIYGKPALTVEQQADQLIARGLVANRTTLIARLQAVNYYRLSGYLYPFRQPNNSFVPGTRLDIVWRRYTFDRRLRMIILDAIERIEVAVRTRLVYHFAHAWGPFGYLDQKNLPGLVDVNVYLRWRSKLASETERAKHEPFVRHFRDTYGDQHKELPVWVLCELMSCGSVLTLANAVEPKIQKVVAGEFGYSDQLFLSWLKALFALRNSCAHHSRVWNRIFGVKPMTPGHNKFPLWHAAPVIPNDRVGYQLTICLHWLGKITTTSLWKDRLFELFDDFPEVPLADMGLPANWRTHPLWI